MDDILQKEKDTSYFRRENLASDLHFFATLCGKLFFKAKLHAGKGNRRVLDACGHCKCVQYLSVKYTQIIVLDPALRMKNMYLPFF